MNSEAVESMAGGAERPLVTFAIYAADEERYIREAVRSALAQTYSPLEIVLSDDASSDRTFEIMRELAGACPDSRRIILNRNPARLGIGNQINRIVELSRGELIVLANGDDIALPSRTERLVQAWLASGRHHDAICSDMSVIDAEGRDQPRKWNAALPAGDLEAKVYNRFHGAAAASLAVSRRIFERFGPLHPNLIIEDNPLALRATLLGGYLHLKECLVKYRVHDGNCCRLKASASDVEDFKRQVLWSNRESFRAYLQFLSDLHSTAAGDAEVTVRARRAAVGRLAEHAILRDFYSEPRGASLAQYWKIMFRLLKVLTKLTIKSRLAFIDRRNARWNIENRRRAGI